MKKPYCKNCCADLPLDIYHVEETLCTECLHRAKMAGAVTTPPKAPRFILLAGLLVGTIIYHLIKS